MIICFILLFPTFLTLTLIGSSSMEKASWSIAGKMVDTESPGNFNQVRIENHISDYLFVYQRYEVN